MGKFILGVLSTLGVIGLCSKVYDRAFEDGKKSVQPDDTKKGEAKNK